MSIPQRFNVDIHFLSCVKSVGKSRSILQVGRFKERGKRRDDFISPVPEERRGERETLNKK